MDNNNNDINSDVVNEVKEVKNENEVKDEVKEEETKEENKECKNEEVKNEEGQEAGALDLIREYVSSDEFRDFLREVIGQVLSEQGPGNVPDPEPEPVPENDTEDAVKVERERVSALLDNVEVVDHATLREFVAQGRTVADLAMRVLANKKEEIARNKASIIAKCESETPVQCVSDRRREEITHENSKENVRSLLVGLGLR